MAEDDDESAKRSSTMDFSSVCAPKADVVNLVSDVEEEAKPPKRSKPPPPKPRELTKEEKDIQEAIASIRPAPVLDSTSTSPFSAWAMASSRREVEKPIPYVSRVMRDEPPTPLMLEVQARMREGTNVAVRTGVGDWRPGAFGSSRAPGSSDGRQQRGRGRCPRNYRNHRHHHSNGAHKYRGNKWNRKRGSDAHGTSHRGKYKSLAESSAISKAPVTPSRHHNVSSASQRAVAASTAPIASVSEQPSNPSEPNVGSDGKVVKEDAASGGHECPTTHLLQAMAASKGADGPTDRNDGEVNGGRQVVKEDAVSRSHVRPTPHPHQAMEDSRGTDGPKDCNEGEVNGGGVQAVSDAYETKLEPAKLHELSIAWGGYSPLNLQHPQPFQPPASQEHDISLNTPQSTIPQADGPQLVYPQNLPPPSMPLATHTQVKRELLETNRPPIHFAFQGKVHQVSTEDAPLPASPLPDADASPSVPEFHMAPPNSPSHRLEKEYAPVNQDGVNKDQHESMPCSSVVSAIASPQWKSEDPSRPTLDSRSETKCAIGSPRHPAPLALPRTSSVPMESVSKESGVSAELIRKEKRMRELQVLNDIHDNDIRSLRVDYEDSKLGIEEEYKRNAQELWERRNRALRELDDQHARNVQQRHEKYDSERRQVMDKYAAQQD